MSDLDAYPIDLERGREVIVCTRCGGSMITFDEAATLHKLLGEALTRFLDPTPITPEPDPPRPVRPLAKPEAQPLDSLA